MNKSILEFWVGLFVLLGVAALGVLAFQAAGGKSMGGGAQMYTVYASFDDIGGLKPQAPIKTAGVRGGRVESIELDPKNFQAKVRMSLDKKYAFSVDSSAKILTSGLLGEQYIGLEQGGEEDKLRDGDTLTLTTSAMVLENLINKFVNNFINKEQPAPASGPTLP